jgi:hypothetical protein
LKKGERIAKKELKNIQAEDALAPPPPPPPPVK